MNEPSLFRSLIEWQLSISTNLAEGMQTGFQTRFLIFFLESFCGYCDIFSFCIGEKALSCMAKKKRKEERRLYTYSNFVENSVLPQSRYFSILFEPISLYNGTFRVPTLKRKLPSFAKGIQL